MTKKESVLKFFLCGLCACALVFSLVKPAAAAEAAFSALSLCARRVVPGVFLFMVAAKTFAACGAERAFSRLTHGAFEKLFSVSESGAAVIFLGLLSGYPAGAAVAGEFIKRGSLSKGEAARILPFATAASPAFLLASVGAMCGGTGFGLIMLVSQAASAFLLLLISRGRGKNEKRTCAVRACVRPLSAFVLAVKESGAAALNICSFVTFFYVFSAMLFSLLPSGWGEGFFGALLVGLLEISCGFSRLGVLPTGLTSFFCGGFMLGFGGFSVLLQSADAVGAEGVSMKKYFLGKAAQAILTAFLALAFGALSGAEPFAGAFFLLGSGRVQVYNIWEICLLFFVFCSFLAGFLIFLIKILTLFKKIFKKLWKKSNL